MRHMLVNSLDTEQVIHAYLKSFCHTLLRSQQPSTNILFALSESTRLYIQNTFIKNSFMYNRISQCIF